MRKIYRLIAPIFLLFLVGCDNTDNVVYVPNQKITFHHQLVYYQDIPFTGTLVGYAIENNTECPDEITVDFVNGLIQGRAQAITMEDIDVSYQLYNNKLDGWTTELMYRVLYDNDKIIDCEANDVLASIKYDVCNNIDKAVGESVTNTFYSFYSLLQNISQRNFTHKDLDKRCYEVYEYGRQFFKIISRI